MAVLTARAAHLRVIRSHAFRAARAPHRDKGRQAGERDTVRPPRPSEGALDEPGPIRQPSLPSPAHAVRLSKRPVRGYSPPSEQPGSSGTWPGGDTTAF